MGPVSPYRVHDLRRTGATTLRRKPFLLPPYIVEAVLHHKTGKSDLQTTYQIDEGIDEVAEALMTWNRYINELMADPDAWPGGKVLQPMSKEEMATRTAALRAGWPKQGGKNDVDPDEPG
jgi:hypothetical protein